MKRVILFIVCMIVLCVPMLSTEAEDVPLLSVEVHTDGSFVVTTNVPAIKRLSEYHMVNIYTKEAFEESKRNGTSIDALIWWIPNPYEVCTYYYPDGEYHISNRDNPAFVDCDWWYPPLRAGTYCIELIGDSGADDLLAGPIEFEIPEFEDLPPFGAPTPIPTPPPPLLSIDVHPDGIFTVKTDLTSISKPDLEDIRICIYTKEEFDFYNKYGTPVEYIMWWNAEFLAPFEYSNLTDFVFIRDLDRYEYSALSHSVFIPYPDHSAFVDVDSWQLRAGTYYVDISGYAFEEVEDSDGEKEKVLKYVVEPISFEIPDTGFTARPTVPSTPSVTKTPMISPTTAPVSTAAVTPAGQGIDYLLWIFIGAAVLVLAGVITAMVVIKKRK